MSDTKPVFSRSISLGNVLMLFLQCGGVGLLISMVSFFADTRSDLREIKANQVVEAKRVDELFQSRDRNGEEQEEFRRRLDRLDWLATQRSNENEPSSPRGKKP